PPVTSSKPLNAPRFFCTLSHSCSLAIPSHAIRDTAHFAPLVSGPEFGAPFVASRCCPAAEQFRGRRDQKGPGRARICFGPQSTVAVRSGSWRESNAHE